MADRPFLASGFQACWKNYHMWAFLGILSISWGVQELGETKRDSLQLNSWWKVFSSWPSAPNGGRTHDLRTIFRTIFDIFKMRTQNSLLEFSEVTNKSPNPYSKHTKRWVPLKENWGNEEGFSLGRFLGRSSYLEKVLKLWI